jgi:hypothetical protein
MQRDVEGGCENVRTYLELRTVPADLAWRANPDNRDFPIFGGYYAQSPVGSPCSSVIRQRIYEVIENSPYYQTIELGFPNIARKIKVFWGHPEFTKLLQDLQTDSSDKPRAGFPADVLLALSELQSIHDSTFPQHAPKDRSIWNV